MNFITDFFSNQQSDSSTYLYANILISALLAEFGRLVYIKFGNSLSNRRNFSNNFLFLATITTLIIGVIRASIALSLGLVGALSIVRFRTAVKEPEELMYLFLCISIGVGMGANERLLTIICVTVILLIISLRAMIRKSVTDEIYNISISYSKQDVNITVEKIIEILKNYSRTIELKRLDESQNTVDILLRADVKDLNSLNQFNDKIISTYKDVIVSFMSQSSLL